jgi:hypothetical protein
MLQAPVRISPLAVIALVLTAACADAPITAADIQADGQLRSHSLSHAASVDAPKTQRAEHLRVTGLLAAQADGPLEDATRFSLDSESIYLHLRADDLSEPRPVTFVWIHGDHRRETMGFLQPSETISLAASLPLLPTESPTDTADEWVATGAWKVEVYSTDDLVFEREFEVFEPEAYEALLLAEASAI